MATIDWPTLASFAPQPDGIAIGVQVPKARYAAMYSGDTQSISHLADRLTLTVKLPPCDPDAAALREAWFLEMVSAGHFVRLHHFLRPYPLGTLRGTPTVQANAAAGARSFVLSGALAAATVRGGDLLGVGTQLLPVAYAGAVASGGGVMTVPLQLPLRRALTAGQAVAWSQPTGEFELMASQSIEIGYGRGRWQRALQVAFKERFTA
jgi:hypothetical protein